MKKSLLALAALTAFAGAASAQSSVTLFGIVDVNLRNQDNGNGSIKSLSSSGINTSRLGFRGVEDLGGGLRAGFWLEGQLDPDTGTAQGQTWQRRSTVSLIGGFGEVRLGRDYKPAFWNTTVFDPFGTNGVGSQNNVLPTLGANSGFNLVRSDNAVGYFLPTLGGVYGQVMVAAGEGRSTVNGTAAPGQKHYGARIGYAAGPVNVAAAYGKNDKISVMTSDYNVWNVGASVNVGFATLAALYSQHEYGNLDLTSYMGAITVPIGAGKFQFSYNHSNIDIATNVERSAKQYAVGYQYDLSKRTALYAHYAHLDNDVGLNLTTSGSGPSVAGRSGFNSKGYEFGVRHSF